MFNANTPSLSDIAAVTNNNDAFGGNNGWWVLILLFAIFGGWGRGGYGYDNYGDTRSGAYDNYVLASDFSQLQSLITNESGRLENKLDSVNNGMCDLGYAQLNQVNGINSNIAQAKYDNAMLFCTTDNRIQQGFAQMGYDMATQFCETRRSIMENCNANYRALNDRMTAMEMSAKNDKIAEQQAKIQALELAASQCRQNEYLISQLRQNPVPAYTVPNPYTGTYGYGACGCNNNC